MTRTLVVLVGAAVAVAAVDLVHKAVEISERGGAVFVHERSAFYGAGIGATALLWAVGVVLTRSPPIAVAGGVVLGGGLGNLASLVLWPSLPGVPNPIVVGHVAFNVADVAVALGVVGFVATTLVFAVRNRDRLSEPVRIFSRHEDEPMSRASSRRFS